MTHSDSDEHVNEVQQLAGHLSATYHQREQQWSVLRACATFFAACRAVPELKQDLHAALVGTRDSASGLIADMFEGLDTWYPQPDEGWLAEVFWNAEDQQLHDLARAGTAETTDWTTITRFFLNEKAAS